jgi:hypothetical protein
MMYNDTVHGIPHTLSTGQPMDISPFSTFISVHENVGNRMTYKILNAHRKIIPCSAIRAADKDISIDQHATPLDRENIKHIVKCFHANDANLQSPTTTVTDDFFHDAQENGDDSYNTQDDHDNVDPPVATPNIPSAPPTQTPTTHTPTTHAPTEDNQPNASAE